MSNFINNFQCANIGNFANKLSDNEQQQANQYNNPVTNAQRFLIEARAEIHRLLDELHAKNPAATDEERISYIADNTTPSFKRRITEALEAEGFTKDELFG